MLHRGKINKIYLGCNISKENEDKIRNLCKEKGIEILKTKASETENFKLLFDEKNKE